MNKLCVASVFGSTKDNPLWLKLQKQFLDKFTNGAYEHVVFLDKIKNKSLFDGLKIIGEINKPGVNHAFGLNRCIDYFIDNPAETYLILDSDCFPTAHNWNVKLTTALRNTGNYFASVMRTELGETYSHPSACFILGEHLVKSRFNFNKGGLAFKNLITNEPDQDVGSRLVINDNNRRIWLPLLRSNKYNAHHIACAIYGDLFYHHGAGTQKKEKLYPFLRCQGYWKRFGGGKPNNKDLDKLKMHLSKSPMKLINLLRNGF